MGVGLWKGKGYENGVEDRNYLGVSLHPLAGCHMGKGQEVEKKLTPHPDLAWCRDGRVGRRCRWGAPSVSTAWMTLRNNLKGKQRRGPLSPSWECSWKAIKTVCTGTGLLEHPSTLWKGDYPREQLSHLLNLAPILFYKLEVLSPNTQEPISSCGWALDDIIETGKKCQ